MATLLLSTIGTLVGGPIGGFIGAIGGRAFDTHVLGLGNQRVEGRRAENLDIQSGSYGGSIPLVFGTGRYAGNVIWSTGLIESREEETQGGKGGPSVTTVRYAYSASFAVGICQGPIEGVGRIWADGKLIRSDGAGLSVGGDVRFYLGDEDQLPDPLIEGDVGLDAAPAYRGMAYAVFENVPLAEFANRIPNLHFEVICTSDAGIASIEETLVTSAGITALNAVTASTDVITGYQVSGTQSYRDAIAVLTDLFPIRLVSGENAIELRDRQTTSQIDLSRDMLGARPALDNPQPRISLEFDHALDLPEEVTVAFTDPSTDYQDAVQRAFKLQRGGNGSLAVNTAMTLNASDAQALAVKTLARMWDERVVLTADVGLQASQLEPGDIVKVALSDDRTDEFEITQTVHSAMITSITARSLSRSDMPSASALPGYSGEADYVQTIAVPSVAAQIFELPATPQFGAEPAAYAAVSRLGGSISTAGLYASRDNGVNFDLLAQVPVAAISGTCLNGLEDRNPALFDTASYLDVMLHHPDMVLSSRPNLAILNAANLAMVGPELIQFATAELLESGAYRLTGFLRGRAGTEHMLMGQAPGQPFLLLRGGDIARLSLSVNDLGQGGQFKAVPAGQSIESAPTQALTYSGLALKPLGPVFLTANHDLGTGISVTWVRRSRTGFAWVDSADAPIGEDTLSFQITYSLGSTSITREVVDTQQDVLSEAEMTQTFGAGPYTLSITAAQISSAVGPGNAASVTVNID